MAFEKSKIGDGRIVQWNASSGVDDPEFVELHRQVQETFERDSRIDGALIDWSDAAPFKVSSTAVRHAAAIAPRNAKSSAKHYRVAIVAPQDLVFGLARMEEALASGTTWVIQVFRERTSALAWLEARQHFDSQAGPE